MERSLTLGGIRLLGIVFGRPWRESREADFIKSLGLVRAPMEDAPNTFVTETWVPRLSLLRADEVEEGDVIELQGSRVVVLEREATRAFVGLRVVGDAVLDVVLERELIVRLIGATSGRRRD